MTTEYLLDTNACIAIRDLLGSKTLKSQERQNKINQLRARWSQVPKDSLAMSIITLGELHFGVVKSGNPPKALAQLKALRDAVRVLNFDAPGTELLAQHYGEIRAALEGEGRGIGANDTWIAAHGRSTGRTVVTNNQGEFGRVPGLSHEDWMA